jgi:hypothetical protein
MADNIEFTTVSLEQWEQIPAPTPPKKKDRFAQLLDAVEKGNIVQLETSDGKNLKGTRIAIARKARNLGFLAEFRNVGTTLYVKRSDKSLEEEQEKPKVTTRKQPEEK